MRYKRSVIYAEIREFICKFCICCTIGVIAALILSSYLNSASAVDAEDDNYIELVIINDSQKETDHDISEAKTINDNRDELINKKVNKFVQSKTLSKEDIYSVDPVYNDQNKMVISCRAEAMCLDIRNKSNWTADDFYKVLNPEMYDLVPVAIKMENELGINAIYIVAVGANETGWGKYFSGKYNYFNWTFDGKDHFNFNSIDAFANSSIDRYTKYYMHEEDYVNKLGFTPSCITPEVVNTKYALYLNGETNWQWSNVVSEIMSMLSTRLYK